MKQIKGRFNLLMHFYGKSHPDNHIDLFFDIGANLPLAHYYCSLIELKKQKLQYRGYYRLIYGIPHRRKYMEYSGKIDQGRGRVKRIKKGIYKGPLWLIKKPSQKTIKIKMKG
ncbi:MAG: hypothetical protein OEZ22_02765 [Spirochaetia bacterium]|nr:hypothetical protein [Spirochaetia bacterium]